MVILQSCNLLLMIYVFLCEELRKYFISFQRWSEDGADVVKNNNGIRRRQAKQLIFLRLGKI